LKNIVSKDAKMEHLYGQVVNVSATLKVEYPIRIAVNLAYANLVTSCHIAIRVMIITMVFQIVNVSKT
jgi:hypothetical protein